MIILRPTKIPFMSKTLLVTDLDMIKHYYLDIIKHYYGWCVSTIVRYLPNNNPPWRMISAAGDDLRWDSITEIKQINKY